MSRQYQQLDRAGGFDYELFELPETGKHVFRGPAIDLGKPYVVFVGAAQTFGRFVPVPFPTLIGRELNIQVLNMGAGGAGPRHFDKLRLIGLMEKAEAVVMQVLSGRSASNSLFDNSLTGGMVGQLRADGSRVRADDLLAKLAKQKPTEYVQRIVEETQADYLREFARLLRGLSVPKILFWLSTRAPDAQGPGIALTGIYPQLVDRKMVAELAALTDRYVESISTTGLPQQLWPAEAAIEGTHLKKGVLENRYYPTPEMHVEAAAALLPAVRGYVGGPPTKPAERFVIVGAPRTGTNLLIGLLNDYENCFVGSELFNVQNIEQDIIPWHEVTADDRAALVELRRSDPVDFWRKMCRRAEARGFRTVGFKLLYSQALLQKTLLAELVADISIAVIHIKRRNLLRRLVSERQAQETGRWAALAGAEAPPPPAISLTLAEAAAAIRKTTEHQSTFDRTFAAHRVLDVVYEDLAERPLVVAARAARFLGLPELPVEARVKHQKTGLSDLSRAIDGYDEFEGQLRQLRAYLED